MGVDAGADCRAADRQLGEMGQHRFDPLNCQTDLARPAAHLLTETDWRRIHQMRAPGFNNSLCFFCPAVDGRFEMVERWKQMLGDLEIGSEMNRRWNDVVARLAHIDVVVRVYGVAA